jgi:hypothetical protein
MGLVWLLGACLTPGSARAVSLIVDRLDTPDVVQAGDTVSFSFALEFDRDEILLDTQAELSAPHLSGFQFVRLATPWDLSSSFRQINGGSNNPMWVHAENTYNEDPRGVTWEETGGRAPLGTFRAIATYNGEIELSLSNWVLDLFNPDDPLRSISVAMDPAYQRIRTGVTIVGGIDLPPPPLTPPPVMTPPPGVPPPIAAPADPPPIVLPPDDPPPVVRDPSELVPTLIVCEGRCADRVLRYVGDIYYPIPPVETPEPAALPVALLAGLSIALVRARRRWLG